MICLRNVTGFVKHCRILRYSNVKNFVLMLCDDCGKELVDNEKKRKFGSMRGLDVERGAFEYMERKATTGEKN